MCNHKLLILAMSLVVALALPAFGQEHSYRLPAVDLHQDVLWGAMCKGPDGIGLKFGGEDQTSDDGRFHTHILKDGKWVDIYKRLQDQNALRSDHDRLASGAAEIKASAAGARRFFFDGDSLEIRQLHGAQEGERTTEGERWWGSSVERWREASDRYAIFLAGDNTTSLSASDRQRLAVATQLLKRATADQKEPPPLSLPAVTSAAIEQVSLRQIAFEKVADILDCEPPPRALSPIVYEPKSKCFVLFGGDHCDYLTNDTWTFDPANNTWTRRNPPTAPPPRANHQLKVLGDGTIELSGGYTYTSNTDYMGGQYRDLNDGKWIYEVEKDTWTGGKGVASDTRVYRTGPFLPNYFLQGPKPDAIAFSDRLAKLPTNTWVYTAPPQLPQMNRDWGSAVIDPDHDLILRFSGGHCAHGGSDVLQFHLATNRWELPFPVEFPLGQLYSNTSYPEGLNFNRRPWITGHTYQNYGYDTTLKKMLFSGQTYDTFYWDPEIADWTGRTIKPHGMCYDSCFYTLTTCSTPKGLVCWTHDGAVFRYDADYHNWVRMETHGEKLPGAEVDNSTVVYDSRRNRLLFARKPYGEAKFNGELHSLNLNSGEVKKLTPGGAAAAAQIPYLCQLRYDSKHELVLVGATLPPDASGFRRTPAYDCAGDRWVSLRIGGDDPSGKIGRNVSLGMMYDAKRDLFWAVDTNSKVFVLRLDPATADLQPL